MTNIQIPAYTERQNRALRRIIDMISATENRAEPRYKHLRRHDRLDFQGVVLIRPSSAPREAGEDPTPALSAWAYNLSSGGIGFVVPQELEGEFVSIGLKRPGGEYRWMTGQVVRSKPIPQEDFFDYGAIFVQRPVVNEAAETSAVAS